MRYIKNWKWTKSALINQIKWWWRLVPKYIDEMDIYLDNFNLSSEERIPIELEIMRYFIQDFKEFPKHPIARDFISFVKEKDGWDTALTDTGEWIIVLNNKELVK